MKGLQRTFLSGGEMAKFPLDSLLTAGPARATLEESDSV